MAPRTDLVGRGLAALRRNRVDVAIFALLAILGAVAAYLIALNGNRKAWQDNDFWFDFDTHRVGLQMTTRDFIGLNTNLHPGWILFTNIPLALLAPLSHTQKLAVEVSLASAAWFASFFVALRFIGLRRFDALLFTGIAGVSAGSLFLSPMPETYTAATATMVFLLVLVAWDKQGRASPVLYVLASVLAMGVTLINGAVAATAIAARFWWKKALAVFAIVLVALVAMSGFQKLVFPNSQFLIGGSSDTNVVEESLFAPEAGGPIRIVAAFVFHGIVAPDLGTKVKDPTGETILVFQDSLPGSGSAWGVLGVVLWAVILGIGVWALLRTSVAARNVRWVLGIPLLALLAFLFVFGQDTFTFSPLYMPLLVAVAALGALTRHRKVVLSLGVVLLLVEAVNNFVQLDRANDLLRVIRSASALVR